MAVITINGKELNYRVRTNPRTKRMCIKLSKDLQLEVVVPLNHRGDIESFLREESNWIASKYEALSKCCKVIEDTRLLYRGMYYPLNNVPAGKKDGSVSFESGIITVNGPCQLNYSNLTRWYKSETAAYVQSRVPELSKKFGLCYNNIYVRSIKAWGMCTRKNDLIFNWQLIALPETISEYVIMHELAHLVEFNHSRYFKEVLEEMCPDFRERRIKLMNFFSV